MGEGEGAWSNIPYGRQRGYTLLVRTESPPRAHQPRLDWDKLGEDLPGLGASSLSGPDHIRIFVPTSPIDLDLGFRLAVGSH